jgi:hypothetical protein
MTVRKMLPLKSGGSRKIRMKITLMMMKMSIQRRKREMESDLEESRKAQVSGTTQERENLMKSAVLA